MTVELALEQIMHERDEADTDHCRPSQHLLLRALPKDGPTFLLCTHTPTLAKRRNELRTYCLPAEASASALRTFQ